MLSNEQAGNDALDVGLNALATVEKSKGGRGVTSELNLSEYARRIGKTAAYVSQAMAAADVYKLFTRVNSFESVPTHRHLCEIHPAPQWLWSALVTQLLAEHWTVEATRHAVGWVGRYTVDRRPQQRQDLTAVTTI